MGGGSKIDGSLLAGYDTGGPSQHVLLIANASRLEPKLRASAARSNANLTFQSVESLDQVTCDDLERTMAVVVSIQAKAQLTRIFAEAALPRLRLVQVMMAGCDWLDMSTVPPSVDVANTSSMDIPIAEHVMACMLEFELRVCRELTAALMEPPYLFLPPFHRRLRPGTDTPVMLPLRSELHGRTLGIIGLGDIGAAIVQRAKAFGMRIVAVRSAAQPTPPAGVEWVGGAGEDLGRLLRESDYVVVSCALNDKTRGLLDADRIAAMKPSAVIINVARGPVIDEAALYTALDSGAIRGAALDVWWDYPTPSTHTEPVPPSGLPFWKLGRDRVILTPHTSGWTAGHGERQLAQIAANVVAAARRSPLDHVVRRATRAVAS